MKLTNGNGRVFLLTLLLLITLTLLTTDHQASKIENYAESVEEAIEIVAVQANKQIEQLRNENVILNQKVDLLKVMNRRQKDEFSKLLGIDGKYDKNNILIEEAGLQSFLDYKVYVKTTTVMEKPEPFKTETEPTVTAESEAPATVIGKYAFMASHTNDPDELNKFTVALATPFGMREKTYTMKVLDQKVTISIGDKDFELVEKYRDTRKDFALFEIKDYPTATNFPFPIGNSDELRVGNFIYINGRPAIPFEVARPGFVTALLVGYSADNSKKDLDEFGISQSTNGGDSGSPIVAFRDGKPELVGIYLGWIGEDESNGKNTRSRAIKINVAIDEIKEKLGIDLREVQRAILKK